MMTAINVISTINAAMDSPTASPTTLSSSSSSSPAVAVDCLVMYSLGTISGPSAYTSVITNIPLISIYSISTATVEPFL